MKPESLYGAVKMWAHLQRLGIPVARCTVERLMRANGWRGVVRTKKVRTTITDPAAHRPSDLVDRAFSVAAPNRLFVADFTYVRVSCGFVYTAFVIDAFAGSSGGTSPRPPTPPWSNGHWPTRWKLGDANTARSQLVPSIIPTAVHLDRLQRAPAPSADQPVDRVCR